MLCTSDLDGSGGIIAYHPAIVMDVSPYVGYQSVSQFRKMKKNIPPSQQIVPGNVANPSFGKLSSNHLVELCFPRKL